MNDQKQRQEHILYVFNGLKSFMRNDKQQDFPDSDFIVGHTKNFIMDVLGYSNSPAFINNPQGRYSVLFEAWRDRILNHLSGLDQESYDKSNSNGRFRLASDVERIKSM